MTSRSLRVLPWGMGLFILFAASGAWAQFRPHPRIWLTPERLERIRTQHVQADSYEWQQLNKSVTYNLNTEGMRSAALAYAVTGDESYASMAIERMQDAMLTPMSVQFNNVGRKFNNFACAFDWLYHSPQFNSQLKQQLIDYVSAVPKDGSGKWNWYPGVTYFNGTAKMLWGPPIWGLATHGDNPLADDYIDNGYEERWLYIRNALGHGPENLAIVRGGCMPQGLDYGSGTLNYITRYLEAVRTATGQDLYDEAPALLSHLEFVVKSYYWTEDFIRRPEHGHNAHKGGAYFSEEAVTLLILMDRYRDRVEGRWASWFMQNIPGANLRPSTDYRYFGAEDLIFSDDSIPQSNPFGESLAYFAEGNGMVIARSDWTSGETEPTTFATFRAGNWTWFNQNHWDQGNFCIYSHGEDLLIDAGVYEGAGGAPVINYHHQTVAHNSITVTDPQQNLGWHFYEWTRDGYENSGGQNRPYRETLPNSVLDGSPKPTDDPLYQGFFLHEMSDIKRQTHNGRYTYAFADMTNAYASEGWEEEYDPARLAQVNYRPKVTNVTRNWLYLRPEPGNDQEYFVTFDRVSSVQASFQKMNHLHFISEPMVEGGGLISAEVPGHVETWRGDRISMERGEAVLHTAIVLPTNAHVRKIGGTGYEYWVNGTNYDPFEATENELGGVWRTEIMPSEDRQDDLFLNVVHPDWRGTPPPDVDRVSGSSHEGASFDRWVVMFSREEADQDQLNYSVNLDGTQRHVICDMAPGYQYQVYRNGNPTAIATVTVGNDGIVEFESPDGGSFQISQGEFIPDDYPPTGSVTLPGGGCLGSREVVLSLFAEDDESGMDGGQMRFSNDGVSWSSPVAYQTSHHWTLAAGDGPKTVYALFADAFGNWMDNPVTDGTTLDDTPPSASFEILEDQVELPIVTLLCDANDNGCGGDEIWMRFSNDGVSWSARQPLAASVEWDLDPQGNGTYTVYARFGDGVDNELGSPLTDTVVYDLPSEDQAPPLIYDMAPPDGSTDVDLTPTVVFVARDLIAGVDTTSISLSLDGAPASISIQRFPGDRYLVQAFPSLAPDTEYTAQARASDLADPPNSAEVTWRFTTGVLDQDTQPPAPPWDVDAVANAEDCQVELNWEFSPDPTVEYYKVYYGPYPATDDTTEVGLDEVNTYITPVLEEGDYWFAVTALNAQGLESGFALLQTEEGFFVLRCAGGDDEPEDDPDVDDEPRGVIWPPGVLVDEPDAPLVVRNLGEGWIVRVFTVSGREVTSFRAAAEGEDFNWDLINREGSQVAKGLYLVRVFSDRGESKTEGYYVRR